MDACFLEVGNIEDFHSDIRGLCLEAVEHIVLEVECNLAVLVAVIDLDFLDEDTSLHVKEVGFLLSLDEEDLTICGK